MLKIERSSHLLTPGKTEHQMVPKGSRGVPNGGKGHQMVTASNIQLGSEVGKNNGPSGPWTTSLSLPGIQLEMQHVSCTLYMFGHLWSTRRRVANNQIYSGIQVTTVHQGFNVNFVLFFY